ncbi:MAG: pyridoxamine 5'-phosphate oxidase family protein [Paraprevotella sp.]|nr:pyridoxamine 5'-phosphate oxidase family protein [Paraprevotella sp.]
MFREMRRKRQLLSFESCIEILDNMTSGTLAVSGDDGYPYAVPVSYVYADNRIYFHSATAGHKIDAISKEEKVSFCVVEKDCVVPEEFTTYFRSVIIFGKAYIVQDDKEKMEALKRIGEKYSPGNADGLLEEIHKGFSHLHIVGIKVEHMTGKEAIEYVNGKAQNI